MKYLLTLWMAANLFQAAAQIEASSVSTRSATNTSASTRRINNAKIQYGTASFYADKFEGRQTANGEIFTQKGMTCAHNSLPLGTWVKVTNLSNKRSVILKVTDRLHRENPRLVDLSKSAAKKLGYTSRGLTKVKVEVLGKTAESVAIK